MINQFIFSFRKKTLLIHFALFICFLALFCFAAGNWVNRMAANAIEQQAGNIQDAESFLAAKESLSRNLAIGFAAAGAAILLLYGVLIAYVIDRISYPIQQIIHAIRPYQDGREEFIPRIELKKEIQSKNEFGQLAQTFNALNARIQKQISNLVEQRERTKEILDSLCEGVIAVDLDRSITYANLAAYKMLGAACDAPLGRKIGDILAERKEMAAKCQELFEEALEKSVAMTQTLTVIEGRKLHFDLIAVPLASHKGIVLVLQDKTSDYEMIEMGKDFIANASHELRTPITIIRGFSETLHDIPKLSASQTKEVTEKILKTSIRLDALVKSLLILADIENLKDDQFQMMDLVSITKDCKQFLLDSHPDVKVALHQKIDQASIWADGDLFSMAIMNLLENAVKYSPSPHQIDLFIECLESSVQLSIQDRGIGIPAADLPRIFDRFYTVDKARSRKFGGTGLGLSIVKTIVQKHRGEIEVDSKLGQGSRFTIRLPMIDSRSIYTQTT